MVDYSDAELRDKNKNYYSLKAFGIGEWSNIVGNIPKGVRRNIWLMVLSQYCTTAPANLFTAQFNFRYNGTTILSKIVANSGIPSTTIMPANVQQPVVLGKNIRNAVVSCVGVNAGDQAIQFNIACPAGGGPTRIGVLSISYWDEPVEQ
jgi:hypothetical protein